MKAESTLMLRRAFGDVMDEESLLTLRNAAQEQSFEAGDIILRQGEVGDAFFVITSGRASVSQLLDDGQELLLGILQPGQYVGELSLLDQAPRMATCRALTPLMALQFNQEIFSQMMETSPAVASSLLLHVLGNMRRQDQLIIEELSQKNDELARAYLDLQTAQEELVEKERLEHEMELGAAAQRSLLPGVLPYIPPYHFAAYQRPARQVGGDFYDVIPLEDDHVGLLLADVADKGLHAALIMAVSRTLFRTEARRSLSPAEVATAVHEGLLDLDRTQETFLTAFYGVLHQPSGRMTYIRAAHEKPLIFRPGESIITLEGGDRFLGMLPGIKLGEHETTLRLGDRLLLFSDGVPDATNRLNQAYGYERLLNTCAQNLELTAEALVDTLVEDINKWIGNADQFDDVTLLAVAVDDVEQGVS
jgi:serine phosphatase RsbU (regulator of sigma subunit)